MQLLKLIFLADKLVDLFDKVRLRLGHDRLNLVDLLVNNLVDLLHVVEHFVSLVIQRIELALVALQLLLPTVHLLTRVIFIDALLNTLHDLLLVRCCLRCVEVRVLMFAIVALDGLLAFDLDWAAEFLDVARERLSEHLRVETWELREDGLEHEALRNGVAFDLSDGHVLKL